jgi:hypothetical protein
MLRCLPAGVLGVVVRSRVSTLFSLAVNLNASSAVLRRVRTAHVNEKTLSNHDPSLLLLLLQYTRPSVGT